MGRQNTQCKVQSEVFDSYDPLIGEIEKQVSRLGAFSSCLVLKGKGIMHDRGLDVGYQITYDLFNEEGRELGSSYASIMRYSRGEEPKMIELLDSFTRSLKKRISEICPSLICMIYSPDPNRREEAVQDMYISR